MTIVRGPKETRGVLLRIQGLKIEEAIKLGKRWRPKSDGVGAFRMFKISH